MMKSERQLIDVAEARGYVETFMADPILKMAANAVLNNTPRVDAIEIPKTGIGDLSDGYHTFNGLYYQRMILFSALVKAHKDRAWKSYRHEDGELCFGGGWFIVGIDTPEGSYTYHYENQYFDMFECAELPAGKPWDGHTEVDVVRLLSLQTNADRIRAMSDEELATFWSDHYDDFCPNKPECGQYIDEGKDIPAEQCATCALKWLRQPAEEVTYGRPDC